MFDLISRDVFRKDFEDMFAQFDELMNSSRLSFSEVFPPMNVFYCADDKAVEIQMALAGYKKSELSITVEKDRIIVEGNPETEEKKEGKYFKQKIHKNAFRRAYELPNGVYDVDKAEVSYEDGILSINIPAKVQEEPASKRIEIQ